MHIRYCTILFDIAVCRKYIACSDINFIRFHFVISFLCAILKTKALGGYKNEKKLFTRTKGGNNQ